jgi:hypothetical protein
VVRKRVAVALFLSLAAAACRDHTEAPAAAAPAAPAPASGKAAMRAAALAGARVWARPAVPPGSADFSVNTRGPGAFDANADVDCTYVLERSGGTTPKFQCTLAGGDKVKVKYGEVGPNGEVPAEIAATRLLTALGFPADRMNRVHSVRCRGCPLLPQQAMQCLDKLDQDPKKGKEPDIKGPATLCMQGASPDRVVTFEHALVERPLEGDKIEAEKDQGWSWYELDAIDPKAGGSSRAEVDALRLMAIVLAHWDNKGANQKLLCPHGHSRPDGSCAAPVAAIGDLGGTFGPKKVDLTAWKQQPIWADPKACRVSMTALPFDGATFKDVEISEAGRQFALTLLQPLTADQLNTLFEASGVSTHPHLTAAARDPKNWTAAFLDKVKQIQSGGPCPRS